MDQLDFQESEIRSWTRQGMLPTWPQKSEPRPRRSRKWVASVVLGASLTIGQVALSAATQFPALVSFAWPAKPDAEYTRQSLVESLRQIRSLHPNASGYALPVPDPKSLVAAERRVSQLPDFVAQALAGVDEDGNVYFRFQQGPKVALVTVEPQLMHALYMEPGKSNVYIDDEEFRGKKLPSSIKKLLENNLTS